MCVCPVDEREAVVVCLAVILVFFSLSLAAFVFSSSSQLEKGLTAETVCDYLVLFLLRSLVLTAFGQQTHKTCYVR